MKDYYVILTGSKDNAGDFLIKYRAKRLFAELRSDREIVDLNAWEPFDQETLKLVNDSKALILLGGPSLQPSMYPKIYALCENLEDIKAPITTLGVGWKARNGEWIDTYNYTVSPRTSSLIERLSKSSIPLSVRDFHTLNCLNFMGVRNVIMTGCPAYYDMNCIGHDFLLPKSIQKIAFSLGVSFVQSSAMERLMKQQILKVRDRFPTACFEVAFHHSLDWSRFSNAYGKATEHVSKHFTFTNWLESQSISYVDVSGSAEAMIDYYSSVDLHLGYRVHAHIFMNSVGKLSLLLSEDARAKGAFGVIGGMVINGYTKYRDNFVDRICRRIGFSKDPFVSNVNSTREIIEMVDYELENEGQRSRISNKAIEQNFKIMRKYMSLLP